MIWRWAVYVDGSGGLDKVQNQGDGWIKLARADASLLALYEVYATRDTEQGYRVKLLGNGALVTALLAENAARWEVANSY